MLRKIFLLLSMLLLLGGCSKAPEARTIRLLTFGYEDSRYLALEQAVDAFNLKNDVQYRLEIERYTDASWNWEEYLTRFNGRQHDLLIVNSDYVAKLAAHGYLEPLDDAIRQNSFQEEYLSPLIPCTMYDGHSWGLLVETEVNMLYLSRSVLEKCGYSPDEIEALPDEIRSGRFTLEELLRLGCRAVENGYADYSVVHRPTEGTFFYMLAQAFQAFEIHADHSIDFSEENFAKMLSFFEYAASCRSRRLPESWDDVNDVFANGSAAAYFGACWSIYDNVVERNSDPAQLEQQYIPTLIPAIRPGESPMTISNSMLITLSATSLYKEDLKKILADAYSRWDLCAQHVAQTYHMPVSRSAADDPTFKKNTFLLSNLYMMDYTTFVPNVSNLDIWYHALFQAVKSAENGSGTPEEVAHTFTQDFSEYMKT